MCKAQRVLLRLPRHTITEQGRRMNGVNDSRTELRYGLEVARLVFEVERFKDIGNSNLQRSFTHPGRLNTKAQHKIEGLEIGV